MIGRAIEAVNEKTAATVRQTVATEAFLTPNRGFG